MRRTSRKIANITYKVVDTLDKKSVKFSKMLFQFRKKEFRIQEGQKRKADPL